MLLTRVCSKLAVKSLLYILEHRLLIFPMTQFKHPCDPKSPRCSKLLSIETAAARFIRRRRGNGTNIQTRS